MTNYTTAQQVNVQVATFSSNEVDFGYTSHIPMLDWDWPNEGHKVEECVTISNVKDVIDLIEAYLAKNPNQSVRLYVTPGGVRAFFLGALISPAEFFTSDVAAMKPDPFYINLCLKNNVFAYRVGPKPNRKGDFVATPYVTLGADPNPAMLACIKKHHDDRIKTKAAKSVVVNYHW